MKHDVGLRGGRREVDRKRLALTPKWYAPRLRLAVTPKWYAPRLKLAVTPKWYAPRLRPQIAQIEVYQPCTSLRHAAIHQWVTVQGCVSE